MKLVGICGAIASGKSTFADLLTAADPEHSLHLETSGVIAELANTFNQELTSRQTELATSTDLVSLGNELIQALLPQLSTMAGSEIPFERVAIIVDDISQNPEWYEKLFVYLQQVQQLPAITEQPITAENKNNYRTLLQWIGGYFLYKLHNPLLWYEELLRRSTTAGEEITLVALTAPRQPAEAAFVQQAGGKILKIIRPGLQSDSSDVTEQLVEAIVPDSIIKNNGALGDLEKLAIRVRDDILSGNLKPEYTAR